MKCVFCIFLCVVFLGGCASVSAAPSSATRIVKGMSSNEVISIMGNPDNISNSSTCSWCESNKETWFYKGSFFKVSRPDIIVVFVDGLVTEVLFHKWNDK